MFTTKPSEAQLEKAITRLHERLDEIGPDSEDYATTVEQLSKLYALRENPSARRVSPDALLAVGGNILGIIMILNHERANVVASKAFSFVRVLTR